MSEACRLRCPYRNNLFAVGAQTEAIGESLNDLRLEIASIIPPLEDTMALQPGNPDIQRQLAALHRLAQDINRAMDQQEVTRQQYYSTDTERLLDACPIGPEVSTHDEYMVVYCGSRAISDTARIANSQTIIPNS